MRHAATLSSLDIVGAVSATLSLLVISWPETAMSR